MMRVEVAMSKPFRGYVEQYAEMTDTTMPQAYVDLLKLGLMCSDIDFNRPPVDEDEISELISKDIETEVIY